MSAVAALPVSIENPCCLCPGDDAFLFAVDGASIVRCRSCGLVRQATRRFSPARIYDREYYANNDPKGGYANYFLDAPINRRTFAHRLAEIERRYGRRGSLLDIGSALGDLVLAARERGWSAEGVEISAYAARRARARGAVVHGVPLAALPGARYDVVTLYDTIEHVVDPIATLCHVRRLLVPGGMLHLVTPNVGGLQARVLGRGWYHYKPDEHLFYFSPRTIRTAIERAGLRFAGWCPSASFVTPAYVLSRLRYYAPEPFATLEGFVRRSPLGPVAFPLYVGEMEAWARRD